MGLQTPVAVAQDIVTDPDLIRQAQEIMYNLNYDFGAPDGINGPTTRKVIRTLQKKLGHPETGDLTIRLLQELRQQKIPSTWGAVSGAVRRRLGRGMELQDAQVRRAQGRGTLQVEVEKEVPGPGNLRPPMRRGVSLGRQEQVGLARQFRQRHEDRKARCPGGLPKQQKAKPCRASS